MTTSAVSRSAGLKAPFLEGLRTTELDRVLSAATERVFIVDTTVTHQGDPADRLFLLTRGRARYFFITSDGRKLLLPWILPGELFGGMSILSTPSFYLASTEMLKDSAALTWDRPTLRSLVAQYPKLLENALVLASDYFSWYLATHAALTGDTARERLAQTLVIIARHIGERVPGGLEIEVTNEDLANAACMTLFTVSRILSEWHRVGALVKTRGKLVLRASPGLSGSPS